MKAQAIKHARMYYGFAVFCAGSECSANDFKAQSDSPQLINNKETCRYRGILYVVHWNLRCNMTALNRSKMQGYSVASQHFAQGRSVVHRTLRYNLTALNLSKIYGNMLVSQHFVWGRSVVHRTLRHNMTALNLSKMQGYIMASQHFARGRSVVHRTLRYNLTALNLSKIL